MQVNSDKTKARRSCSFFSLFSLFLFFSSFDPILCLYRSYTCLFLISKHFYVPRDQSILPKKTRNKGKKRAEREDVEPEGYKSESINKQPSTKKEKERKRKKTCKSRKERKESKKENNRLFLHVSCKRHLPSQLDRPMDHIR